MQRLLITIPLLLVMLPGCGNAPPADQAGPGSGAVAMDDILNPAAIGADGSVVLDSDGDGFSDDEEINSTPGTDPFDPTDNPNNVRDTDGDGCSDYDEANFAGLCNNDPSTPEPDLDGDGALDGLDNCPLASNPSQFDSDADGIGDVCDVCLGGNDSHDADQDGVPDACDNCVLDANGDQLDADANGIGDACDFALPPTTVTLLPPSTLTIRDTYGSDALELSDGTVWEVTFGFTFGWFAGDRVDVDFFTVTNLDRNESVTASKFGTAITHTSILQVSFGGQFVDLLDGTSWEIDTFDRIAVSFWVTSPRVVVVEKSLYSHSLVRESDGKIVRASPLP